MFASHDRLPMLAFGQEQARDIRSIQAFADLLSGSQSWMTALNPVGDPREFRCRMFGISFNSLKLVASASTAMRLELSDATQPAIIVPFAGGKNLSKVPGSQTLDWYPGHSGVLMPACARSGEVENRSIVTINFEPAKLATVGAALQGAEAPEFDFQLDTARRLPLAHQGLAFDRLLRQLCQRAELCMQSPQALAMSGIDDSIYRILAMMLQPQLLLDQDTVRQAPRSRLDQVCDYILAHLDQPLGLSQLERLGGMSRRSLQYAFLKRFGISPTEWIIAQRLERAQQRLRQPQPGDNVTRIAGDLGFTHLSQFAARYKRAFGESPSDTLKQTWTRLG